MKIQTVVNIRTGIHLLLVILVSAAILGFGNIILCIGSMDYMDEIGTYNTQQNDDLTKEAVVSLVLMALCVGSAFGCSYMKNELTKIINARARRSKRHTSAIYEQHADFNLYPIRKQTCRR